MKSEPSTYAESPSPSTARRSGSGGRFQLTVTSGASAGTALLVSDRSAGRLFIGTSPTCDLRLDDKRVSRRHLAVETSPHGLRLSDLGSTNGTWVSGLRVEGAFCQGGELVRLGDSSLRVDVDHETSDESPDVRMAFGPLVGASLSMRRLYRTCDALAGSRAPLLIEGAAGTGKLALAEALHLVSHAREPSDTLFVVHEASKLTTSTTLGAAGTCFLREIGEAPIDVQTWLAREVPLATSRGVRVIAGTRRDLDAATERGAFREELLRELTRGRIELPPLASRRGDVMLLVEHFCRELGAASSDVIPAKKLADLNRRDYPENVRELRAIVATLLAGEVAQASRERGAVVPAVEDLGLVLGFRDLVVALPPFAEAKEEVLARFSSAYVSYAVAAHGGHVSRAAAASGLAPRYFNLLRARGRDKDA